MKNAVALVLVLVLAAGAFWFYQSRTRGKLNPEIAEFHKDAERLIQGLQQYREFFKHYPSGTSSEISKALSGQGEGKVVIFATSSAKKNDKDEIVDTWGSPIQFYFTHNAVLIRSAGPNKVWEDSRFPGSDDLYRTDTK
jgi:hypothetical protein